MIPLSLTIRGLASHDDTAIDFRAIGQPGIAICAPKGTGKTVLVEGLFMALYGFSPFYASGSLYELMTQGGTGDALVEVLFDDAGETYRAERVLRDTGKSKTQKATLERYTPWADAGNWTIVAGPKVKDFEAYVAAHFGSQDLALATWMMSQPRRGDLCGTGAERDLGATRREVFDDLIDTARLVKVEAKIGEKHREAKAVLDELDRQLAVEQVEDVGAARLELLGMTETRTLRIGTLHAAERDLEAARTRLRDAEGGDDVLHAQIREHTTADERRAELVATVRRTQKELAAAVEKAAGKDAAQHDVERANVLRRERDNLNDQATKFSARRAWESRAKDLRHDLNNKLAVVQGVADVVAVDDETRILAGRVQELREQWRTAKGENEARADRNRGRALRRDDARGKFAAIEAEILRLETEQNEKPETPFGDQCSPCPLMQKWAALPERHAAACQRLVEAEDQLSSVEADEELADLSTIIAEGEQAKAAAKRVAEAEEWTQKAAEAQLIADVIQRDIESHASREPEQVGDPAGAIAGVQHELDKLAGASERHLAAVDAGLRAEALRTELADLDAKLSAVEADCARLLPAAESARESLRNREAQRVDLRGSVAANERRVRESRDAVDAATREIGAAESRIAEMERRQRERTEKMERAKALRESCESLAWLRGCYGPKGARQLMIDAAVPELEAIVDDLFDRATGGAWRIRIATQRLLEDQVSTVEDFAIRVRDDRGERDVLGYSGGERNLIRILFRIGILLWRERVSGHKAELLILDEAFDNLGAEGAESLLGVLDFVSDRIKQTIVVTHDPAIASRMPGRVFLEKRALGVEVAA